VRSVSKPSEREKDRRRTERGEGRTRDGERGQGDAYEGAREEYEGVQAGAATGEGERASKLKLGS
jgi:hypothetical protein